MVPLRVPMFNASLKLPLKNIHTFQFFLCFLGFPKYVFAPELTSPVSTKVTVVLLHHSTRRIMRLHMLHKKRVMPQPQMSTKTTMSQCFDSKSTKTKMSDYSTLHSLKEMSLKQNASTLDASTLDSLHPRCSSETKKFDYVD